MIEQLCPTIKDVYLWWGFNVLSSVSNANFLTLTTFALLLKGGGTIYNASRLLFVSIVIHAL